MSVTQAVEAIERAVDQEDGDTLVRAVAGLLSVPASPAALRAAARSTGGRGPKFTAPACEAKALAAEGKDVEAFESMVESLNEFRDVLSAAADGWPVQAMIALIRKAYEMGCAINPSDQQRDRALGGMQASLRQLFPWTIKNPGKAAGAVFIANTTMKLLYKLRNLSQCKRILDTVHSSRRVPEVKTFPPSQRVTFWYYAGRLAMFQNNLTLADKQLTSALTACPRSAQTQIRLIMRALVPVRLALGRAPALRLLTEHKLDMYRDAVLAFREGDVLAFEAALAENRGEFIRAGVYLLLERVHNVVYRNLFRRTVKHLGTHQVKLDALLAAVEATGMEMDLDELEGIVATLIRKTMIRGYLSLKMATLVTSKTNAFPQRFEL